MGSKGGIKSSALGVLKVWRKRCFDGYRYGFNGKERDGDLTGNEDLLALDYGFRIYNPAVGRFLSVDPLTQGFPWYTPYQFAGNTPIMARDVDGLEPQVEGGILVGYIIQRGQGPTQISADLNNPETQMKYGYALQNKVEWTDIINVPVNNSRFFSHIESARYDKFNEKYRVLNMNEGQYLHLPFLLSDILNSSGIGHFIGPNNDIYNESIRVFTRAIRGIGQLKGSELIDVRFDKLGDLASTKSLLSPKFRQPSPGIYVGQFIDDVGVEFKITIQSVDNQIVNGVFKSILNNIHRNNISDEQRRAIPFAFDVQTTVDVPGLKDPAIIRISFKDEAERDNFWNSINQIKSDENASGN